MRILIAAHTAAHAGGVESYLATLVPALGRHGHEVACCLEAGGQDRQTWLAAAASARVWMAGSDRIRSLDAVRKWSPEIVFAHGMKDQSLETALLDAAPSVFFAHSYYATCISGSKSCRVPSDRICTRVFGPACLVHYYPRRCGGWSPVTMRRQYAEQRGRRRTLDASGRIAVASSHMAEEYARHGFGSKVRVVGLPVGASRPSEAAARKAWRLLFMGRLERTKGADIAVAAAAEAAAAIGEAVQLQISGDGTESHRISASARRAMRRCPHLTVTMTGWLTRAECETALAQSDLLLMPSRWPEPFGLAGLEAFASGVPVVAFDAGGIRDWLAHGVNGLLVSAPPDAARFAKAILECLRDPDRLARFRAAARATAGRFAVDAHVARLEAVFDEIARPAAVGVAR